MSETTVQLTRYERDLLAEFIGEVRCLDTWDWFETTEAQQAMRSIYFKLTGDDLEADEGDD